MRKSELTLIVRRVLEDHDIDDRNLSVDLFLEDLATTIEYETDLVYEEEPEEDEDPAEEEE